MPAHLLSASSTGGLVASSRDNRRHRRIRLTLVALVAASALLAACGGGGDDQSTDTTTGVSAPKVAARVPLCAGEVTDGGTPTPEVERLVANLIRQASLPEAEPYDDYALVCDNTGVTTIEAPVAYRNMEPAPLAPLQTAIRVSPDFSARVEEEPIINFFAAPVGGSQFPTQPGFGSIIQQSADGSLSSGTRDPREGKTISEECAALPIRDIATGDFTGRAQFFVNCGDDQRAWVLVAATPDNADPYFIQVVAEVLDTADAEALGRALTTMHVDKDALAAVTAAAEPAPAPDATTTTVAGAATPTTATP